MMVEHRVGPWRSIAATVALVCLAGQSPGASATHLVDLASIYGALGEAEAVRAARHVQDTLEGVPSRQTVRWSSADGRATGTITPLRTFKIRSGYFCREFVEAVAVGPDLKSEVQVACRDESGLWQRVEQ